MAWRVFSHGWRLPLGTILTSARPDLGTLFSIQGFGFNVVHNFTNADGINPYGDLSAVGSTLYGTNSSGGANRSGTLFSIDIDGTGLQVLHNFGSGSSDGLQPSGDLAFSGSTLFGTTDHGGGAANGGSLYAFQVPEPSTAVLLGLGAVYLLIGRQRRRRISRVARIQGVHRASIRRNGKLKGDFDQQQPLPAASP